MIAILTLLFAIAIAGIAAYVVQGAPISEFFKRLAFAVIAIGLLVYVAHWFGAPWPFPRGR